MKASLVDVFNQEKALVGAFSVIVKTDCETDGAHSTSLMSSIASAGQLAEAPVLPCHKKLMYGRCHNLR